MGFPGVKRHASTDVDFGGGEVSIDAIMSPPFKKKQDKKLMRFLGVKTDVDFGGSEVSIDAMMSPAFKKKPNQK